MKRMSIALALLLLFSLIPVMSKAALRFLSGKELRQTALFFMGTMKTWALRQWGGFGLYRQSHEQGKKIQVPYVALDLPASTLRYWDREMPTVRPGLALRPRRGPMIPFS